MHVSHAQLEIWLDKSMPLITHLSINFKLDLKLKIVSVLHVLGTCEVPQQDLQPYGPLLVPEQVGRLTDAPQLA